jgi:hypothetical protein
MLRSIIRFFSFFEKPDFPAFIPEVTVGELLEQQLNLIPDLYKTHPKFTLSIESFAQHKYELVLESLIELAVESGHYFSQYYWEALAQIADKLKLPARAQYCTSQNGRTLRDGVGKIPLGWVMDKQDATHRICHIAESIKESWNTERRQKDRVEKMLANDGFHMCAHGRAGMIYYVSNRRVLEIGYDIAGGKDVDYIIYFEGATHWALPVKQELLPEEKEAIRGELGQWLGKVRANF